MHGNPFSNSNSMHRYIAAPLLNHPDNNRYLVTIPNIDNDRMSEISSVILKHCKYAIHCERKNKNSDKRYFLGLIVLKVDHSLQQVQKLFNFTIAYIKPIFTDRQANYHTSIIRKENNVVEPITDSPLRTWFKARPSLKSVLCHWLHSTP
jgi:hypothetical protein